MNKSILLFLAAMLVSASALAEPASVRGVELPPIPDALAPHRLNLPIGCSLDTGATVARVVELAPIPSANAPHEIVVKDAIRLAGEAHGASKLSSHC